VTSGRSCFFFSILHQSDPMNDVFSNELTRSLFRTNEKSNFDVFCPVFFYLSLFLPLEGILLFRHRGPRGRLVQALDGFSSSRSQDCGSRSIFLNAPPFPFFSSPSVCCFLYMQVNPSSAERRRPSYHEVETLISFVPRSRALPFFFRPSLRCPIYPT